MYVYVHTDVYIYIYVYEYTDSKSTGNQVIADRGASPGRVDSLDFG